jgi:5-formyltetrahydrofolate cyclo-ligase
MTTGFSDLKARLRKETLTRRDALAGDIRIEHSLQAAEHGLAIDLFSAESFVPGTVVAGFFPIRSEIDARPLMYQLAKRGARLCLPVVLDKTNIEFRELVRGAPLVDTGFGTTGPGPNATALDPQILLMPLSVFDAQGGRIGYGAGHYDRAIAKLTDNGMSPRLMGMAFALQQTEKVPMEAHDQFLEGIITECGYIAAGEQVE